MNDVEVPKAPSLIDEKEAARRTTVDRVTLWRWVNNGTFPRPFRLNGSRRKVWLEAEVTAWIVAQAAAERLPVAA